MLVRSPSGRDASARASAPLSTGCDSPVRAASATRSCAASIRRRSAGTTLPASSSTTSPGTSSAAGSSRVTALATHPGDGRGHPAKRRHGALGAVLLGEPDGRVEQHDDEDGDGVRRLADQAGDDRRRDQHQDHEIRELVEHHPRDAATGGLRQLVAAVPGESRGGFRAAEPPFGLAAQGTQRVLDREGMPGGGLLDPGSSRGACPRRSIPWASTGAVGAGTCGRSDGPDTRRAAGRPPP